MLLVFIYFEEITLLSICLRSRVVPYLCCIFFLIFVASLTEFIKAVVMCERVFL